MPAARRTTKPPADPRKPLAISYTRFSGWEQRKGDSKSRAKSMRSLANWDQAVEKARREKRVMTRRLPGWIEEKDGALCLIENRAVVVRRLFTMAMSGYGAGAIVKRLNVENVPAFGD